MKKSFLFLVVICFSLFAVAQTKRKPNETTVVRDSAGMQYPYVVWQKMVSTGDYRIRTIHHRGDTTYMLVKLDSAQKDERMSRIRKPSESKYFTEGEKIKLFDCKDIDGNKIKVKDLEGKVVVLNFWFIGCPPCRKEIPELNKLAMEYKNDPNVVFIAVALDEKYDIKQFIKDNPFGYHIIDDGRYYANLYGINLYPTNVVLDKEGKVQFHSSGLAKNTPYWIKKTIAEVK